MNESSHDRLIEEGRSVRSRADFASFVQLLAEDFERTGDEWENRSLGDYLSAMVRWTDDCDGYYRNMGIPLNPDEPQWRVFADILLAARVYE